MKLENKFFKAFFYPFFISTILSTFIVMIFLGIFNNNKYDKRSLNIIFDLERKLSKINMNTVNILLTTTFQKIQISLNEHILYYQRIAKKLLDSKDEQFFDNTRMKCALDLSFMFCFFDYEFEENDYLAIWSLDDETYEDNVDEKREVKLQLIAFNNIIPNLQANLEATKPNTLGYSFYFEENELYISYPIKHLCDNNLFYKIMSVPYSYDSSQCLNENAEFYTTYKYKCEFFFKNYKKSRTDLFDNNYLSNINKTIFISNYYEYLGEDADKKFNMCIEFDDPITKGKAYSCTEVRNDDLIYSLENLNTNIIGYYFITIVGYNNVFYFPQGPPNPKTIVENIFNWDLKYNLDEKANFYNNIKNIFSSNYIEYINDSFFEEIFIDGKNENKQYFYLNEKKYKYSIYPVLFENLNGKKEHIFSIIYIYNDQLYLEKIQIYNSSLFVKIVLVIIIFIIFGSGLLYIIYLTFNTLTKYIVIPIKNVNYMLKGINIGGKNRLNYLDFLKKKQDEKLEELQKAFLSEKNKINKNETLVEQTNEDFLINKYINNLPNEIKNKQFSDVNKKYDEENNYIEKEYSFYDFDELLLQYRPLEIETLVKSLIYLKEAFILTSDDRKENHLINYSHSEKIFRNYKNKEGAFICQSNMGNLQSQLLQYDKTIYHLSLSLQDNHLKNFFSKNLSDELDESDSLLNIISNLFKKEKKKNKKSNILSEKQKDKSNDNLSQKNIDILLNNRYCRLIHAYYMFFKNMKKINPTNNINDNIKGQFTNTLFHKINYYHKILIQFIYLSFVKNDLVKIGESILDYIEFLIQFKFKTSSVDKDILDIRYQNIPELKQKKDFKRKIFNKIIEWFNLFDNYIDYIKENSSLGDNKSLVDCYHNLDKENNKLNMKNQSAFMFKINIQKCHFLKGKFCLYCKNYIDALYYFIQASKKKSIIIDGLIKKKSLKHIYKIIIKMNKKYNELGFKHLNIEKQMKEFKKNDKTLIRKTNKKNRNSSGNIKNENTNTFGNEIEKVKNVILKDINELNESQERDILIIIDFNIYNEKAENNINSKTYLIDKFIEETLLILNNYLSSSDRFCVLIYSNKYQIVCPLMNVSKIDSHYFAKDLTYYKTIILKEKNKTEENEININDFNENYLNFYFDENNIINNNSIEESFVESEKEENHLNKLIGLVKTINYLCNYSKMKETTKNEKYIILFTDFLNMQPSEYENIQSIFEKLEGDKGIIFLIVGKNSNIVGKINKNLDNLILNKFGLNSEVIYYENMKTIKSILAKNIAIKDEIFYPNEIYK